MKLKILLAKTKTKSCPEKLDEIVYTNDILHIVEYRSLNKSVIVKLRNNDELDAHYIIACYSLKELVFNKVKEENQTGLIKGPYKTNPKKASRFYLTS